MDSDGNSDSNYSDGLDISVEEVPMDDPDSISLFASSENLAVNSESGSNDDSETLEVQGFDTGLSSQHLYLGNDFKILSGRVLFDEGSYHTLELLHWTGIVLVPGQTLPLTIFDPRKVEMLQRCIAKDRTFGVVCKEIYLSHEGPPLRSHDIGTTAEILEYQVDAVNFGLRLKAKARQRFKIISVNRHGTGLSGTVKILPEVKLLDPLHEIKQSSLNKHRTSNPLRCRRRDAWQTAWPEWVYKQYDAKRLVNEMRRNLSFLNHAHEISGSIINLPEDPTELSFWVAHSLPILEDQVVFLLKLNSPIQRLRWEMSVLEKLQVLCCNSCENSIGSLKDAFFMSVEGTQATYVNPGGYVFKTLTLYKVTSVDIYGPPSSDFSWFPGYSWAIASCKLCSRHVGWKFTTTNNQLKPKEFWGLCRNSFNVRSYRNVENVPVL